MQKYNPEEETLSDSKVPFVSFRKVCSSLRAQYRRCLPSKLRRHGERRPGWRHVADHALRRLAWVGSKLPVKEVVQGAGSFFLVCSVVDLSKAIGFCKRDHHISVVFLGIEEKLLTISVGEFYAEVFHLLCSSF